MALVSYHYKFIESDCVDQLNFELVYTMFRGGVTKGNINNCVYMKWLTLNYIPFPKPSAGILWIFTLTAGERLLIVDCLYTITTISGYIYYSCIISTNFHLLLSLLEICRIMITNNWGVIAGAKFFFNLVADNKMFWETTPNKYYIQGLKQHSKFEKHSFLLYFIQLFFCLVFL